MKIGYPCINTEIGCTSSRTFRLASYSEERLVEIVNSNLDCLEKILKFNLEHGFFFFRITSDLVPFASHPVCTFDWENHFKDRFVEIGNFVKSNSMRVSMHPDQFVLINALDSEIVERSVRELEYHASILNLMGIDETAKLQVHVGGVYGDRDSSVARFIKEYKNLPDVVKNRLVIENDERSYSLQNCLEISEKIGIPIVFDTLHHDCLNNGESYSDAMELCVATWKSKDGVPIVDYSTQDHEKRKGAHAYSVDIKHFKAFIKETKKFDFDIMLEIKDKQKSALKVLSLI